MKIQTTCNKCSTTSIVDVNHYDMYVEEEISYGEVMGYNVEFTFRCPKCGSITYEKVK